MLEQGVEEGTWAQGGGTAADWRMLRSEELHDLHSSPNITWVIESSRMRRLDHVACIGDHRIAYRLFLWKPEGETPLAGPKAQM